MSSRNRISWIDAAKACGIILVIIGHTVTSEKLLQLIYSFHMPMFFIASAITTRKCESLQQLKQDLRKNFFKLIPLGCILTILIQFHLFSLRLNVNGLKSMMLTFLFQRGDTVFLNEHLVINAMGLPWFLFALFHGKLLVWVLDLLEKKARTIKRISENINGGVRLFAECTLFVTGIGIAKNEILPFAIDVVLQLPLYMRIGKFVYREEKNLLKTSSFIVLSIVWLSLNGYIIYNNNTHIGMGNYYVEPLCYLTAVVGTIACFGAAKLITQNYETHISKWVCFIGKHSLCLFCVHAVDFYWMQYVPSTVIPNCIIRVGIDLIVAIMFINLSSYIKSWR